MSTNEHINNKTNTKKQSRRVKKKQMPIYAQTFPDRKTIFIGGLCFKVTEGELTEFFGQFGKVFYSEIKRRTLRRRKKVEKGESLGCAVIVVDNEAQKKILKNDHFFRGHKIDCKEFLLKKNRKKFIEEVRNRTLEIKQLPIWVTEKKLRTLFKNYGEIDNLYILTASEIERKNQRSTIIFKESEIARRVALLSEQGKISLENFQLNLKMKGKDKKTTRKNSKKIELKQQNSSKKEISILKLITDESKKNQNNSKKNNQNLRFNRIAKKLRISTCPSSPVYSPNTSDSVVPESSKSLPYHYNRIPTQPVTPKISKPLRNLSITSSNFDFLPSKKYSTLCKNFNILKIQGSEKKLILNAGNENGDYSLF